MDKNDEKKEPIEDISSSVEDSTIVTRPQVFTMLADPILERVYKSRLQSGDYCLVWCEKGERWKESLLSFPYDVVVVDFSLFSGDPIETLVAIRKLSPESEIIVLTESQDVRTAIAAFRLGVTDYFLKPTDPERLAWSVETILKRKSLKTAYKAVSADFDLFSTAHQITTSESDSQMRTLAMKFFIAALQAEGGLWLWPEHPGPNTPINTETSAFRFDGFQADYPTCERMIEDFRSRYPGGLTTAFPLEGFPAPEIWYQENLVWLPLRASWMGGVLLFGLKTESNPALTTRLQFLLQSLEVSIENHRRYAEVKQLTYLDDLTGLYNARYLDIAVAAAIDDYKRTRSGFSILFIDIDKFKSVNDNHGHLVGSQMLIELANHLKRSLRKPDHLFRYGGDEFIALLYEIDAKKALEAAERLRLEIEQKSFYIQGKEYKITLSIGVARFPDHGQEKQQILQMADDAMYNSKKSGRNRVFIAADTGISGSSDAAKAETESSDPNSQTAEHPKRKLTG